MAAAPFEQTQKLKKLLMDYSFVETYPSLVDYTVSENGDCNRNSICALDHTLDSLKSHLEAMKTTVTDDVCCRLRSRVQLNQQMKNEQRRVSLVLESEQNQEEQRKVKVIQDVVKTTKKCSRKLTSMKVDTGVFRRFSPRRTSLRGGATSRKLKKYTGPLKLNKLTARRQTAFSFLLLSEKLCFKAME